MVVMKTYYLIHGWDGNIYSDWFPWLKDCLEKLWHHVVALHMPDSQNPKINEWVWKLEETIDVLDEQVFFVAHSIWCQTVLRYLEKKSEFIIWWCYFVAPWFDLIPTCLDEESRVIAKPWIETPIDFSIITLTSPFFVALFSDNDYCVSLEEKRKFEQLLWATTRVFQWKGHFATEDGCNEIPELLHLIDSTVF